MPAGNNNSGSGDLTAKYVIGATDGSLPNGVVIPGMNGSADIKSAGVNDDEFDTVLTGWTLLNAPNIAVSNSDLASHLHLKANANANQALKGIYKASPSIPFTVSCKITDCYARQANNKAGLILANAGLTAFASLMFICNDAGTGSPANSLMPVNFTWSSLTAPSALTTINCGVSAGYLRMVVNSSTSVDCYYSINGLIWRFITNFNPGITVANVGLGVDSGHATYPGEMFVDWIRFT